ncbi:pectinesterase inhibitor 10-like [Andrographis paniculata]|uniref:pectinesterase inhibitor 10-like n=1 Tax=Andrographis paniculata TaxID=175694 RepID=UPI0021E937D4|nr:pectinesterase inhibitor 10-like [Andrographis paniculata]
MVVRVQHLQLLFLSSSLTVFFHSSARFQLDASPAPSRAPAPAPSPSPSPGPAAAVPTPAPSPSPGLAPAPSPSPGQAPVSSPSPSPSSSISVPPASAPAPAPSPSGNIDSPYQVDSPTTLSPSANVDPKVKGICGSTHHSALCLATAVPLLRNDEPPTVASVLEVTIKAGAKLAKHALSEAKKATQEQGKSADRHALLRSCTDDYEDAVINYQNAVTAFPRSGKGTMNTMLSKVMTAVRDCEDGFSSFREDSPLSAVASRLTNVTSNCLSIISQLD